MFNASSPKQCEFIILNAIMVSCAFSTLCIQTYLTFHRNTALSQKVLLSYSFDVMATSLKSLNLKCVLLFPPRFLCRATAIDKQ